MQPSIAIKLWWYGGTFLLINPFPLPLFMRMAPTWLGFVGGAWAEETAQLFISLKPEFPRLNWLGSLGTWAENVDESKGSNKMLFTQLVEGKCWESPKEAPVTHPAADQGLQPKPHTPSPAAPLYSGLCNLNGINVNRHASGVHLGVIVVGKKQQGKSNCIEEQ